MKMDQLCQEKLWYINNMSFLKGFCTIQVIYNLKINKTYFLEASKSYVIVNKTSTGLFT